MQTITSSKAKQPMSADARAQPVFGQEPVWRRKTWRNAATMYQPALLLLGMGLTLNATATLAPNQGDTYINSASPGTKYGTANNLQVSTTTSTLVKFDLATLPAGTIGLDVEKATVLLWVNNVTTAGNVTVYAITSPWAESSVTYNLQPGLGAPIATVPVTTAMEAQYLAIDVTAQVRSWLDNPGSNHGLQLKTSLAAPFASLRLDSKENVGIPATLDITLLNTGAAGPAGAAATIAVGATVTGAAGTAATVTNSGTSSAALLTFTVPAGAVGAAGTPGAPGATGATGAVGAMGPAGAIGPMGASGVAGATGATGASGASGAIGPVGPAGPQGAIGVSGAAGTDGKTILNGATAPSPTDGVDGDFYVNTSASVLFGPKALGAWPATGVSLVGPAGTNGADGVTGATGATGAQGPGGATGATGAPGIAGAPGATGAQGLTGATGAQGAQGPQGPVGPAGPARFSVYPDGTAAPEFGYLDQINFWWIATSPGRFATRVGLSTTPDPVTHKLNWFIVSLGGDIYWTATGCTGDPYSADAPYSIDSDIVAASSGTFTYKANLVLDVYTPDFTQSTVQQSFPSRRQPNGSCITTNSGSLKARRLILNPGTITFNNSLEMRY